MEAKHSTFFEWKSNLQIIMSDINVVEWTKNSLNSDVGFIAPESNELSNGVN